MIYTWVDLMIQKLVDMSILEWKYKWMWGYDTRLNFLLENCKACKSANSRPQQLVVKENFV